MGQRREAVLDDWAAGFTAKQIADSRGVSINSVKRTIKEARAAGDERARRRVGIKHPAPEDVRGAKGEGVVLDEFATLGTGIARDVGEALFASRKSREEDEAALKALRRVHRDPSRVSSLQPAPEALGGADARPLLAPAFVETRAGNAPRRLLCLNTPLGDPPPGRSALDRRRVG